MQVNHQDVADEWHRWPMLKSQNNRGNRSLNREPGPWVTYSLRVKGTRFSLTPRTGSLTLECRVAHYLPVIVRYSRQRQTQNRSRDRRWPMSTELDWAATGRRRSSKYTSDRSSRFQCWPVESASYPTVISAVDFHAEISSLAILRISVERLIYPFLSTIVD